jgi:sulfoxide reductase heme-binding subunit YedZ
MPFLREKSGKWSPEKIIAFAGACVPIVWLAWRAWSGDLSAARPVNDAIHSAGNYTVWLVVISLAISPARRLFMAPKLINMRRTLGVAAFCYAALHITLYIVEQKYDLAKVVSEIALRFYLTIGFVALLGLIALAATSTDGMIKRLGAGRWNRLHQAVYIIAILGVIHFLLQTKIEISESIMAAGFLVWLLGYRVLHRFVGDVTVVWQLVLTIAATVLTACGEALWYRVLSSTAAGSRVFAANLDWDLAPRPAHWVLIAGLSVTLAAFLWSLKTREEKPSRRTRVRPSTTTTPVGAIQTQQN